MFIGSTSPLCNNSETSEHNQNDEDIDFHDLYMQLVKDTDEEKIEFHDVQSLRDSESQAINTRTTESQTTETQINEDSDELFLWYSKCVVNKIMEKMGYKGKMVR